MLKFIAAGAAMIEKTLRNKITQLIDRAPAIANVPIMERTTQWTADGEAWVTEAANAVQLAVPDFSNAYRMRMVTAGISGPLPERIPAIASLLRSLLADIDAGLVGTLATKVQAETFDNFLDHAVAYQGRGAKNQAGVIAGAVFEDTIRKIHADKVGGITRGHKLDELISELKKKEVITEQQSHQARAVAFVRTKASHAAWDEFDMRGVDDTIGLTRTLLKDHLM